MARPQACSYGGDNSFSIADLAGITCRRLEVVVAGLGFRTSTRWVLDRYSQGAALAQE